jgi:hypothetical protein
MPNVRDVTRRVEELAQGTRYPSGVTDLVCIGERKISGVFGSHYIPQPLEYEGEDKEMLLKWMPQKVEQTQLF